MGNKIQPILKSEVVLYGDQLLQNFWRQKAGKTLSAKSHREEITEILQSVDEGIVCIQTEALTDKALVKQIFDTSRGRQVKIYILVNEYSQELDMLNEICLIRYGVKNIGSFILVNPNSNETSGVFFGGQLTEGSIAIAKHISRELDKKEIPDLFRHFCFHFWETAKKEVIEKGKQTDVVSKPLDIFYDVNAFDGKDFVYGTLFDFVEAAKRGEMSGKFIVPLNQETQIPTLIKLISEVDLQDNKMSELLSNDEFEKQQPELKDDKISVKIKFSWKNVPFYLPERCDVNSLYKRWQDETERIKKHLDSIIEKIDAAEKKEATISKKISRFFLGKKTIFGKLKSDVEDLKSVDFANISESTMKEKVNRINEIYKEIEKEVGEIEQEDKKAKLDEEIENLNAQILEQKIILENKQTELESKQQENAQKFIDFCLQNEVEKDKLYKLKNQWEQEAKNKKDKEKSELANQKLSKLQQIQKDVFLQKCIDDKNKIEQEIRRLENTVKSKEQEKNKQVQQSVSSSSLDYVVGNKSQSNQSSNQKFLLEVPNLPQLPKVGKLYQLNSQPYLAIEFWEQYEQGKAEAERMKAKLCAIK
ncbi:hypothetical protein AGMMS50239_05960 [Bacteroidia bacterium]|nr:hypothetical protein AGMMS50239_05960 [Bacteroidia bacterium]